MDKQTISLLRSSFAEIAKRRPDVAAIFYQRLFEVAPAVRPLFPTSLKEQQRKLTASLAQVVAAVDQPDKLLPHLERLGERHVAYKAQPAHYKVVGDVLLWTFAQVLKQDFTLPVRAAWTEAYSVVAQTMMAAAQRLSAASPAKEVRKAAPKRAVAAVGGKRKITTAAVGGKRKAAVEAIGGKRKVTAAAVGGKRKAAARPARKPVRRTKSRSAR